MGYEVSDVLIFYGIVFAVLIIWLFRRKGSSTSGTRDAGPEGGTPAEPASPVTADPGREAPPAYQPVETPFHARAGEPVTGLFVVVTAPDPQTQIMAMSLSSQAKLKGKTVRILLCGPAGDLALIGGKEVILKPLDKSPQMLLKALIDGGVRAEVCPFYLANRGGSPADLIAGVTQAAPPEVADGLLEPGVKLFTF